MGGTRHRAGDWTVRCVHRRAGSVLTKRPESTAAAVGLRRRLGAQCRGADCLIAVLMTLVVMERRSSDFRDGACGAAVLYSGHHLGWAMEPKDGVGVRSRR
jgi:hypothetical protein